MEVAEIRALIEEVEAASEGSRELSDRVVEALTETWEDQAAIDWAKLQDVTRSLDDCERLMPEEFGKRVRVDDFGATVEILRRTDSIDWRNVKRTSTVPIGRASTEALAWSAALLRAELARRESSDG